MAQSTLQKMSGQDIRKHPPMVLLAIALVINMFFFFSQTALFSELDSLPSSLHEGFFIVLEVLPPFNGGTTFWLVMMALR